MNEKNYKKLSEYMDLLCREGLTAQAAVFDEADLERHIEYIEKILNESNGVEIRLIDGDFIDDFKNKENTSLYLSKNLKFTKVHPESGKNDYFIISDNEFKGMCTDLFDKLWNTETDVIITNKDEILDIIK